MVWRHRRRGKRSERLFGRFVGNLRGRELVVHGLSLRVVGGPRDTPRQEFVLQAFDLRRVEEPDLFGELLVVGIFGLQHHGERVAVHVVDA